jgi:hypothetical protein
MKPLQHEVEHLGQPYELDSPLSPHLLPALIAIIQIMLVQQFRFYVPLKTELETTAVDLLVDVLDAQDEVLEGFFPC